ncbi:MAG: hypothetical protein HC789_10135 [Microcoleus sp. CSU_2_2]|nr:hypothetical protein [Microcoleus sp. SU_5_3]NJS10709.1 hypothetical protein [Microcoleus sp. CSU_2_2]
MTTTNYLLLALKLFSVLGCGLIAGVFFAFSTFGLDTLPTGHSGTTFGQ